MHAKVRSQKPKQSGVNSHTLLSIAARTNSAEEDNVTSAPMMCLPVADSVSILGVLFKDEMAFIESRSCLKSSTFKHLIISTVRGLTVLIK